MFFKGVVIVCIVLNASLASKLAKRGIFFDSGYGENSYDNGFGHSGFGYGPATFDYGKSILVQKSYAPPSISPAEIAGAIQAAKEASANVMAAQQRVQDAKEAVLHQQHVASQKQADAALALQRTEAAAAIQQQEAKAAANSLVHSQQRLAQAKADVSEQQKIAAIKEAHAAAIIHKSANAAAHEIQRTDDAARKLSAIQHSGTSALRQAASAKQLSLTATSAAVAASNSADDHGSSLDGSAAGGPWYGHKLVHLQPWG